MIAAKLIYLKDDEMEYIINKYIPQGLSDEDCWNYKNLKSNNYPSIRYKNNRYLLSRLIYLYYYGKQHEFMLVCHKCDNPSCINPKHLFLGTYQENTQDMIKKGRHRHGPGSKSTVTGF